MGDSAIFYFEPIEHCLTIFIGKAAQAPFLGGPAQLSDFYFAQSFALLEQPQAVAHDLTGIVITAAFNQTFDEGLKMNSKGIATRRRRPGC